MIKALRLLLVLSLLIGREGYAATLITIGRGEIPPNGKVVSAPIRASSVTDGLRINADIDPALLVDEGVEIELGVEESDDGINWRLLGAVGHDSAKVVRYREANPTEPLPSSPFVVINVNNVDPIKSRDGRVRGFVMVHQTRLADRIAKRAVSVGMVVDDDATTIRQAAPIPPTHSSVAFDALNTGTTGTGTSTSFSFTTTGSDRCLFATFNFDGGGTKNSAATYNSVAMASIAELVAQQTLELFRLVAPASSANTLAYTFDSSISFATNAISFTGVDQTDPDDTPVTTQAATGTSMTSNVSSATGNLVIDAMCVNNGTVAGSTPGANQTTNPVETSAASNTFVGMSYEAGGTTITMSWSWTTGSTRNAHISMDVNASAGAAASVPPRSNVIITE